MSQRQYVSIEHPYSATEHIPLSEAKLRVAAGELYWIEDYKRATTGLVEANVSNRRKDYTKRRPHHIRQWIWKDHFGYTLLARIPKDRMQEATA